MAEAPLWVTLVVGLGAGVLGSLLTTTLRIRHEREADLRSRMLEAADEFVAAATKANERIGTLALRRSLAEVRAGQGGNLAAPTQADLDALGPLWDEASATLAETVRRLPRIRLLFGVDATAAERAGDVCRKHSEAMVELVGTAAPRGEQAEELADDAETLVDDFSRAARADLQRGSGFFSLLRGAK